MAVLAGEAMEKSLFTAGRKANYIATVGINGGSRWKTSSDSRKALHPITETPVPFILIRNRKHPGCPYMGNEHGVYLHKEI